MNRWLASGLGRLNGLIAFLLILGGLVVGITSGGQLGSSAGFAMGLTGAVIGVFLAILLCGFLAILIDMKDTLRRIEEQQHSWQALLAENKEALPDNDHRE